PSATCGKINSPRRGVSAQSRGIDFPTCRGWRRLLDAIYPVRFGTRVERNPDVLLSIRPTVRSELAAGAVIGILRTDTEFNVLNSVSVPRTERHPAKYTSS